MLVGDSVELVGDYYITSYKEYEPHRKAIGWKGLSIGQIIEGRAAPYLIVDSEGPIGWAPITSLRKTGQTTNIIEQTPFEEFISVNFVSMSQDIINYSIACKESWPFSLLEEKLYKDYPEYNNPNTYFMTNASMIDKNKTLKENKIKNNSVICVYRLEN